MSRRLARNLLIGITAVWLLMIIPCGALGLSTVFLADSSSGLDPDIFAMIFFGSLAFPAVILLFTPMAWVLYYFEKNAAAVILGFVPLFALCVPMVGFFLLMQ